MEPSLCWWTQGNEKLTGWLSHWRVGRLGNWVMRVNRPEMASDLEALRLSVQQGVPLGAKPSVVRSAKREGIIGIHAAIPRSPFFNYSKKLTYP